MYIQDSVYISLHSTRYRCSPLADSDKISRKRAGQHTFPLVQAVMVYLFPFLSGSVSLLVVMFDLAALLMATGSVNFVQITSLSLSNVNNCVHVLSDQK